MNLNKTLILTLLLSLVAVAFSQPLTGTKTIGGTSPNYATFALAIAALNTNGVGTGGVVFNVRPGTYAGRFTMTAVTGASATNRVTFKPESGTVTIADSSTGSNTNGEFLVRLNGADYVTFNGINVVDISTQAAHTIEYGYYLSDASATNGCQYDSIENCSITLCINDARITYGIYQNNSTANVTLGTNSYNHYLNLKISKVRYGIYLNNPNSPADTLNEIGSTSVDPNFAGRLTIGALANDTIGFGTGSAYGVYGSGQAHLFIHDCDIQHVYENAANQSPYGIDLTGNDSCFIYGNRIHDVKVASTTAATGTAYGMYINGNAAFYSYVYNNQIWGIDHSSTTVTANRRMVGISVNTGTNYLAYNSILMNPTTTAVSNACITTATGSLTDQNNILYNKSTGYAGVTHYGIYVTSGTLTNSDYNVFYNADTLNGRVGYTGGAKKLLTDWQGGVRDLHSYEGNPLYVSAVNPINLQIQPNSGSPASNWGTPISWISTDLKGTARNATHPDIGSDEGNFGAALPPPASVSFGALTTTSITVNWSLVTGAAGYRLESSTDGVTFTLLSSPVVGTTYNDTGLPNGNTQRYYRVYSINNENVQSLTPSPINNTYTLANVPAAPTVTTPTTTSFMVAPQNSVSPANTASTQYAIQVGAQYMQANGTLGATAVWQTLATWGTDTVTGLAQNTTYVVSTIARNGSGTASASSTTASITTYAIAPAAVTFGTITTTSIVVNWTAVAGATYRLEYSNDGITFNLLSSPVATNTFTNTGLPNGNTQRYYRVYSINTQGALSTSPSPVNNTYTLANTPATPTTANITNTTVQVTPQNSAAPTNTASTIYAIQVGTRFVQANGTLSASAVWQTLAQWGTITVTGLAQGTAYAISTEAQNGSGTNSAFSTVANITTTATPLNGGYTIDRTQLTGGTNYQTFTAAISALNTQGIAGPITFTVASNTYADTSTVPTKIETFPLSVVTTGTSSNPIVFQKATGGTVTIVAGASTDNSIVRFYGSDYITFDGIDLAVRANAIRYGYYFRDNGTLTSGAQHNTVKNCIITLDKTGTSIRGVLFASATGTPTSAAGANSYNLLDNVTVHNAQFGLYLSCNVGTYRDSMNTVQNCHIGVGVADDISIAGAYINGPASLTLSNNVFANVTNAQTGAAANIGDLDASGIRVNNLTGTSLFERNLVYNIAQTGTGNTPHSALGIYLFPTAGSVNVYNNMVYGISKTQTTNIQSFTHTGSTSNPGYGVFGILIIGTATASHVYHNSVLINATTFLSSAANYLVAGTVIYKNNVFSNITPAQGTGKHYGFYTANYAPVPTIDYDCIYSPNANGFVGAYLETDNTWAAWQSHSYDTHGLNSDPLFVSGTDLHIQASSGSPVSNVGTGGLVTNDYDGMTRNLTTPDIGADEGSFAAMATAPTSVTFGASTLSAIVVNWAGATGATTYKLQSSTDGGTYTDLTTTASTTYTNTGLPNGNTQRYYRIYSINVDTIQSTNPSSVNIGYTLANTPAVPTVDTPTATTIKVTPQNATGTTNTAITQYAIQVGAQFVQANSTLGVSAVWQTLAQWSAVTVTGLTQNTTYVVSTKARNGLDTTTASSPTTSLTTLATTPAAITFGTPTTTSIPVNWTAVAGATYRLEYSTDGITYNLLSTPIATNTYSDTGLPNGNTQRYYRVYSINSVGALSATPSPANNTYALANTPALPTVANATATTFLVTPANSASPANTSSTQYAIQVESQYVQANGTLNASAVWQTLAAWSTDTVNGLIPATTYHVSVKARNGSNTETAFSTVAPIVTLSLALPPAPMNGTIDNVYMTSLRINWTAPSPAGTLYSYEIQVSTTNASTGFSVLATDLSLSPTNYTYTSLPPFTNFWFRIYSKNSQGYLSSSYETAHGTTKPNWHSYLQITGGPGDTTAWIPTFPNDSLTGDEPATRVTFAAVNSPSSNPSAVTSRWDTRANAISLWGVNQSLLNTVLPANQAVNRVWDINPTGGSNFNATLKLSFTANDLPPSITNPVTQITRAGYKHGTQNWAYMNCTVTGPDINGVFTATVNNVNALSDWVLGTSSALLPVTLQSFTASNDDRGVVLHWYTETEVNIDHYRIDRWKANGPIESQIAVPSESSNGWSATPLDYVWRETEQLVGGTTYDYQLTEIDLDGSIRTLATATVVPLPTGLNLLSAYPNPFNPTTTISFTLAVPEKVRVSIFNVNGELVKDLYYGEAGSQKRIVTFDAKSLPSGVYYARIMSAHYNGSRKLVLMK